MFIIKIIYFKIIIMETIASFNVDHTRLLPWIYVSRKDKVWENIVTTFDLRFKKPNIEPVIDNPALHTIEHLWATFLRNHKDYAQKTIYFWPMWCRTWFYVILNWNLESKDIVFLIKEMIDFVISYKWKIPGQSPEECWNFLDLNLPMAQYEAFEFKKILDNLNSKNLNYPK